MRPALFTFDVFGTVLDWKGGLAEALGRPLDDATFDRVIDHQGRAEQAHPGRAYRDIVAGSLVEALGVPEGEAERIGASAGRWRLFPDAAEGMRRLMAIAPCAATTNSDRAHGEQVQAQLGFRLSGWLCAEEIGAYKPARVVWEEAARRLGARFDRSWWHVSAYGDYDLEVARALGLTCVFVRRPHHRPGPHDVVAADLVELAAIAAREAAG
jgi:2-haloalkanoic acid dehalogenase type II